MVYLNNAATSYRKAPGVAEAVAEAVAAMPELAGRAALDDGGPVQCCRMRLAELLGVSDPTRVVLGSGATHALNLALLGLGERRARRAVTTVTEHNSVLRPLYHMRERHGTAIALVGLDEAGGVDVAAFERALEGGATLAAVNHASNVTGRVNDVARLFALAHQAGAITLLDASQSLGHVPVHPEELGADLVAFTGHKALLGPAGTGGLYVAPHIDLEPVIVGGTGVRGALTYHPPEMPVRLEAGTPNLPGLAGLAVALEWLAHQPVEVFERAARAAESIRQRVRDLPRIRLLDGATGVDRMPVVSVTLDGWDADEAGFALASSFGILSRTGLHCSPLIHQALGTWPKGTVRLSPSVFTTDDETDAAVDALARLVG